MHIAGKYGRLFELKERVDAGVFTNQAYAANRNRSKLLQGQSMHYGQPNGLFVFLIIYFYNLKISICIFTEINIFII